MSPKRAKVTIVVSPLIGQVEVEQIIDHNVTGTTVYYISDNCDPKTIAMLQNEIYRLEAKYSNLLKGLEYWKNRVKKIQT